MNTVPAQAHCFVDVRTFTADEQERVRERDRRAGARPSTASGSRSSACTNAVPSSASRPKTSSPARSDSPSELGLRAARGRRRRWRLGRQLHRRARHADARRARPGRGRRARRRGARDRRQDVRARRARRGARVRSAQGGVTAMPTLVSKLTDIQAALDALAQAAQGSGRVDGDPVRQGVPRVRHRRREPRHAAAGDDRHASSRSGRTRR